MPVDPRRPASPFRYDNRTIFLHWAGAALVLLLWCLGQTIDWFPRGTPRVTARSLHITIGVVLAVVFAYRIWWRLSTGRRLPASEKSRSQALASLLHVGLYLLLVATVSLGLANVWVRGDSLYQIFTVPEFDPGNKALKERVEDLHSLLANTLFIVAALHAAISMVHHFALRDNVLRRMLASK